MLSPDWVLGPGLQVVLLALPGLNLGAVEAELARQLAALTPDRVMGFLGFQGFRV